MKLDIEEDPTRYDNFVSVRVEKTEVGTYTFGIAQVLERYPSCSLEVLDQIIKEKLSLLILAPVGVYIKGTGRKFSSNPDVYYLRFFEEDRDRLKEKPC